MMLCKTYKLFLFCLFFLFCYQPYGQSFQVQDLTPEQLEEMKKWKPLEVTGDAIPWHVFAKTGEMPLCTIDAEGFDLCLIYPLYDKHIVTLDQKKITVQGYMFPLELGNHQKQFLIGPYPLHCPYHYHIGSSQVIEVIVDQSIEFTYDPLTFEGILDVNYDMNTGTFFYLRNAHLKK